MKKYVLVKQHDETDCGAACLASVAKYYGKNVSISRIRNLSGTDSMGTSGLGIVKGAEALGLSAKGFLSEEKDFPDDCIFPVIAHVKKGFLDHYVVVYGKVREKLIVADPDGFIEKLSLKEFQKSFTGIFFLIVPMESFKKTKETKGLFERFIYLLKPYRKTVLECFTAGLILSILGAVSAFYFRFLIDDVLYSSLKSTLTLCSLAYLFVIIFQVFTEFARNQLMNFMGNKIDLSLVSDYFNHVLHLPLSFFTSRKTGEILSRIQDTETIRNAISSTTLGVIIDSCMLICGGIFLFLFGSDLLIVTIIPVLVSSLIVWFFVKPFRKKLKEMARINAEKQASFLESINGIATVKALNSEDSAYMRSEMKMAEYAGKSLKLGTLSNTENLLHSFVSMTGTLALYWIGSLMIFDGKLSLGQLISFVTLSGYFTNPLSRLLMLQENLQEALIASDRLSEILDMSEENELSDKRELVKNDSLKWAVDVRNLSFSYGTRGQALKNVNLSIKPGEKIAFVGPSGSGKTTMTKLLMKFYKAEKGTISVDGMSIDDIDTECFRNQIGYVPQEVLLFSGTIAENIAWGSENKKMQDIVEAAKKAQADRFIMSLQDRYGAYVGEKGATLSGGERQRISLARVLLRNPSLMILDEATSSLDSISERKIMETVDKAASKITMVIVAHRLSTIKNSDRIFVFDKGRIVESGKHSELLKMHGKYYEMWNAQEKEA